MIAKKDRVKAALEGRLLDMPPCGEIALMNLSFEKRMELLGALRADLVVVHLYPDFPGNERFYAGLDELKYYIEHTDYFVIAGLPGLFWQSIEEISLEVAVRLIKKVPEKYCRLLKNIRKRREMVLERLETLGVDAVFILDDLAGKNGPFISPGDLRKFILPELEELIRMVKQMGKPIFFHSDGNIKPILADLIDLGVDVIHGFDGMDLAGLKEVREIIDGKAAFMGNFSLHFKNDDIKSLLANLKSVAELFEKTGYIFSSDGGFTPGAIENLVLLYQYFHQCWEGKNA